MTDVALNREFQNNSFFFRFILYSILALTQLINYTREVDMTYPCHVLHYASNKDIRVAFVVVH